MDRVPLADLTRLIVLHLGGGGSARLFIGGKMVDGVRDDEWMFAPERMGGVSIYSRWWLKNLWLFPGNIRSRTS